MGVEDLQTFLTGTTVAGGTVPAELLRIARSTANKQTKSKKREGPGGQPAFSLVVDVECCLDRLYGGFYSDWVSGGQWSRMVQFLAVLNQTVQSGNIELVFFFNGSLESQRINEWVAAQLKARQNVNEVLKHTSCKGTPPPKIWWVPPTCLRTALRMAMRHLHMTSVCSMDDHRQEAIAYLRENGLHGLVADDVEYAVFDPPRYFSASHLKMTYKGMVETVEYQIGELAKALDLPREHFSILAALLGNYLLTSDELAEFYQTLGLDTTSKIPSEVLVKAVANFVKALPTPTNLDSIALQVFGSLSDKRSAKLKQSIQYYKNGTKDGFLLYQPSASCESKNQKVNGEDTNGEPDLDTSKFASETQESEQESLAAYNEATAALDMQSDVGSEPVAPAAAPVVKENGVAEEKPVMNGSAAVNGNQGEAAATAVSSSSSSASSGTASPSRQQTRGKVPSLPPVAPEVIRTSSERHQKGLMSPYITQILTHGEIHLPVLMEDERHCDIPSIHLFYRPVRQMVYAILFNLHHHKYIATRNKMHANKEGEKDVKNGKEKDTDKTEIPEVVIKEWVWSKTNQYERPDLVHAEQIGWGVPTIHRLWFGSTIDDKRRRLRAFLTCMRSDTALMLNPLYVPQHLLVLACVLRYIMTSSEQILREQELDAILVQAVCPELMNVQFLQDLQLSVVTTRGIQLGTLIMAGVETALVVNDACGAPVPWLMCCPWLYFDGKLLQHTLARAAGAKNLRALCGNRLDQVVKVQKMRQAILEGLTGQFARAPLPSIAPNPGMRMNNMMPPAGMVGGWHANRGGHGPSHGHGQGHNQGHGPSSRPQGGRGGLLRRPVPSRGGQLEVAGVVVCSWGANYGSRGAPNAHPGAMGQPHNMRPMPPQITSVGVKQYGRMGGGGDFGNCGFGRQGQRPTFPVRGPGIRGSAPGRGKKVQVPKKRNSNSGSGAKKILTSKDNVDKKFSPAKSEEAADADGLATVEGMMNSVLISDSVDGLFSPLNGDKKRDEVCDLLDQGLVQSLGQGDGPASAPGLAGLAGN